MWLRLLLVASMVIPGAIFGVTAWQSRLRTLRDTDRDIMATVRLLGEQAGRILQTDEQAISQVDQQVQGMSWTEIRQSQALHARLDALVRELPQIDTLSLVDRDGHPAVVSGAATPPPIVLTDRDYFVALRDHADLGTFITPAYPGRWVHRVLFSIVRRKTGQDGAFDGVIAASVNPTYLASFYASIAAVDGLVISLIRTDGAVLVRYPVEGVSMLPQSSQLLTMARQQDMGLYVGPSLADGLVRRIGFAHVTGYPLLVSYGMSQTGALAPWYYELRQYGLITGVASLLLVLVTILALRGAAQVAAGRRRLEQLNISLAAAVEEHTRAEQQVRDLNVDLERRVSERTRELSATALELERERSRLATFIDASPFAKLVVDGAGQVSMMNAAAEKLFGYPRNELVGQSVDVLVPARSRAAHGSLRDRFFASAIGRPMGAGLDLFALHKDGTEVPVEVLLSPQQTPSGLVVVVGIADITARREAQNALLRVNRDLVAANQELVQANATIQRKSEEVEAFVYIVSHDLRAPLINLQGFSHELERGCAELERLFDKLSLPDAARERLKLVMDGDIAGSLPYITASVAKFDRLINALLEVSRTGRYPLHPTRIDVDAVAHASADALHHQVESAGARLVIHRLPEAVADATALGQVFANLIGNAVKFADPDRSLVIEIDGEVTEGMAHYRVKDNGRGISDRAKTRLFQMFQRFHPDVTQGDGIGLATIRRLVERLGGKIWADSEAGVGTIFHFILPTSVVAHVKETA